MQYVKTSKKRQTEKTGSAKAQCGEGSGLQSEGRCIANAAQHCDVVYPAVGPNPAAADPKKWRWDCGGRSGRVFMFIRLIVADFGEIALFFHPERQGPWR
jgi:hypothetical protein